MKKRNLDIIGYTSTGKGIHKDPTKNTGFKKEDHMEAYRAHASYLMYNQSALILKELHKRAMNEHYRQAMACE